MQNTSLATKYWRDFEKLSLELLEDQFQLIPSFKLLSRPTKDDGKDGVLEYTLSDEQALDIQIRVLLEAKLRAKSGIGLSTFAKTLVIAHNRAAEILVIVSNQQYTKQAVEEVSLFAISTRMKVKLIDGKAIAQWVKPRTATLLESYPAEFIDWLEKNAIDQPSTRKYSVSLDSHSISRLYSTAKLSIGADDSGNLSECEIVTERENAETALDPVVGRQRQDFVEKLSKTITKNTPGLILVEGDGGTGKSFLVSHAFKECADKLLSSKIDLKDIYTTRQLFLTTFERLTGISLASLIACNGHDKTELKNVLKSAMTTSSDDNEAAAAATVMLDSDNRFEQNSSLNEALLIDYLGKVAGQQALISRFSLSFENTNNCNSDVLNFLLALVPKLVVHGFVLIELRTDDMADHYSPTEWSNYKATIRRQDSLANFVVPTFTKENALELIDFYIPNFGNERSEFVLSRVGNQPLFIELTCEWLKNSEVIRTTEDYSIIKEVESFFEGLSPDRPMLLVRNILHYWMTQSDKEIAKLLLATAILGGDIPIELIEKICTSGDIDKIFSIGLFSKKIYENRYLSLQHGILCDAIEELTEEYPLLTRQVAQLLIGEACWPHESRENVLEYQARCSYYSQDWHLAYKKAEAAANRYSDLCQLEKASALWELAYLSVQNMPLLNEGRDAAYESVLFNLLSVEKIRNRIQLDKNSGRISALETHINLLGPELPPSSLYKVLLLKWRRLFLLEKLSEAKEIAETLLHQSQLSDIDEGLAASSYSSMGLTYKGMGLKKESLSIFQEGFDKFPSNKEFAQEYWSNIAAHKLVNEPKAALKIYNELVTSEQETLVRPQLHNNVDIAMAYFLIQNYKKSSEKSTESIQLALSNSVDAQEARARNIYACCLWVDDKLTESISQIELAILAAERSFFFRFLWRMRTNAASLYALKGDKNKAKENAMEAIRLIVIARKNGQDVSEHLEQRLSQRWYVALLICTSILDSLLVEPEIKNLIGYYPSLMGDIAILNNDITLQKYFGSTSYLHQGHLMITG